MTERIISDQADFEDLSLEQNLRPHSFDQYIGQDQVKNNLKIFIEAAKMRMETLDHVLLYGPPGLGKTTLAAIIANEMGETYGQHQVPPLNGPVILLLY